jgi:hypothetical protein
MTRYAIFRLCPRGVDYLGTVEADSRAAAEDVAERQWTVDVEAGEELSIEEDEEDEYTEWSTDQ